MFEIGAQFNSTQGKLSVTLYIVILGPVRLI